MKLLLFRVYFSDSSLAGSSDRVYTVLTAPTAWRAPETFVGRADGLMVVTAASDVYMLGCALVEVMTGCQRQPFDWLMADVEALVTFRKHPSTREVDPLTVRQCHVPYLS